MIMSLFFFPPLKLAHCAKIVGDRFNTNWIFRDEKYIGSLVILKLQISDITRIYRCFIESVGRKGVKVNSLSLLPRAGISSKTLCQDGC